MGAYLIAIASLIIKEVRVNVLSCITDNSRCIYLVIYNENTCNENGKMCRRYPTLIVVNGEGCGERNDGN